MNTYIVRFQDQTIASVSVAADGCSLPEQEWEHILFYTGDDRDPDIVYSVAYPTVLSVTKQQPAS